MNRLWRVPAMAGVGKFLHANQTWALLAFLAIATAFSTGVIAQVVLNVFSGAWFGGFPLAVLNLIWVGLGVIGAAWAARAIDKLLFQVGKDKGRYRLGGLTLLIALISALCGSAFVIALREIGLADWFVAVIAALALVLLCRTVGVQIQKLGALQSTDAAEPEKNKLVWSDSQRPATFPEPQEIETLILAMSTGTHSDGTGIWETFGKDIAERGPEQTWAGLWTAFAAGHDFGSEHADKAVYGDEKALRDNAKQNEFYIGKHPWAQPLRLLSLLLRELGTGQTRPHKRQALRLYVYVANEGVGDFSSRNGKASGGGSDDVEIPDFVAFSHVIKKACECFDREAEISLLKSDNNSFISHFAWDELERAIRKVVDGGGGSNGYCIVDITSGRAAYSAAATMACLQTPAKIAYIDASQPGGSAVHLRRNFRRNNSV